MNNIALIGYACGMAASNPDCALGPWSLYYTSGWLNKIHENASWEKIISASSNYVGMHVLPEVTQQLKLLSQTVLSLSLQKKAFCVIGGDHSCGMGTWSGVACAQREHGDIGLIWIDAHMDSHTLKTSTSKNIHGMPVAHLLGHGEPCLTQLSELQPALKPENLCLIGIRSYQPAEKELLQRLGVRVFYIEDIRTHGVANIINQAVAHVSQSTCGFGVSIDLDAIDPNDAPGVGNPEANGIPANALISSLNNLAGSYPSKFLGLEIAEYNPTADQNHKTAKILTNLIHAVYQGSQAESTGLNDACDLNSTTRQIQSVVALSSPEQNADQILVHAPNQQSI